MRNRNSCESKALEVVQLRRQGFDLYSDKKTQVIVMINNGNTLQRFVFSDFINPLQLLSLFRTHFKSEI